MEWTVVTVIIALVGLLGGIVTPIIKLNSTITKLTAQVESFIKGLDEFKARYTSFSGHHILLPIPFIVSYTL